MKAGVKRIEATLHNLDNRTINDSSSNSASPSSTEKKETLSFRISTQAPEEATPSPENLEENTYPQDKSVQTFSTQEDGSKLPTPNLPKFKTPNFTNHRNGANPGLSLTILSEIQQITLGWQTELQKTIRQIQDIYLEGPIVDGWLESQVADTKQKGTATLRHAEVDRLMDYVEEICSGQENRSKVSSRTEYRLCGLDDSGQAWSRPCPPDQVPSVSMAIARYQKLRQLLGRKQYLETRLSQLAESLVVLHGHIQGQ